MESKTITLNGKKIFVFFDSFLQRIKSVRTEEGRQIFGELTSGQLQEIRKQIFQ